MSEIVELPIDSLTSPCPRLLRIYGEDPYIGDLVRSIEDAGGILRPIHITPDKEIIGGYRRWKAAKFLGIETVPCRTFEFENEDEKVQHGLHDNKQRRKTPTELWLEALEHWDIESKKAGDRRGTRTDITPISAGSPEFGETREIVAEYLGMGRTKLMELMSIYDERDTHPQVIHDLENRVISVHGAWNKIKGIHNKEARLQEKKAAFFRIIAGVRRISLREELLGKYSIDETVRTTTEKDLRKEIFINLGTPVGETFLEMWRETKSNVSDAADEIALSDEHYRMSVWHDGPRNFVQLIIWMDESEGVKPLRRDTLLEHNFNSFRDADDHARKYGGYCQGLYNYAGRNYWVLWVKEELLPKEEDDDNGDREKK